MHLSQADRCRDCGKDIDISSTECPRCCYPVGFPNVRFANREEEELLVRYEDAICSLNHRGVKDVAKRFENIVENSYVIMNRSLNDLISALDNSRMVATFHQQVASKARAYENNQFDRNRDGFESKIHPIYYDKIHYGLLSAQEEGCAYYGSASIKFCNKFIEKRTTFFEENSYNFIKKHQVIATEDAPVGYRSTWENRAKLAIAKLHSGIKPEMSDDELNKLLLDASVQDPDFIEAHIYGTVSKDVFDSVLLKKTAQDSPAMINFAKEKLEAFGINVEERGN